MKKLEQDLKEIEALAAQTTDDYEDETLYLCDYEIIENKNKFIDAASDTLSIQDIHNFVDDVANTCEDEYEIVDSDETINYLLDLIKLETYKDLSEILNIIEKPGTEPYQKLINDVLDYRSQFNDE